MTSFRYLRSLSQIYCLRIDFAFCLGCYTRTLLAKLCSVFKVLPPPGAWRTGQLFNFNKLISSCQELFWICFSSSGDFLSPDDSWIYYTLFAYSSNPAFVRIIKDTQGRVVTIYFLFSLYFRINPLYFLHISYYDL